MSGIVSGMNYSLLFASTSNSTSSIDASILSALYSGSTSGPQPPTTFVSSGDPITDLKLAQQEQTTGVTQEAKQPQVAAAVSEFTTAVSKAKTIQAALGNPAVQQVLLTANGLSNYIGQTALVQKMFMSDPSDPKSLVNKFGNSTWSSTVQTYDFAKNGLATLQNPKVISALTSGYAEVKWRQGLDQATPGLSNALTFLSQASSIKSLSDVLGSFTNFDVITIGLGIPQSVVNQDTTALTKAINSRLDYSKLQDRQYVTSLTDQYLLAMQQQNSTSSGTSLNSLAGQMSSLLA